MLIDTHCHFLYNDLYKKLDSIVENCLTTDTLQVVNIECDPTTLQKNIEESNKIQQNLPIRLWNSIGVHPDFFDDPSISDFDTTITALISLLRDTYLSSPDTIVAIGECGLDYYRTYHKEAQHQLFLAQLDLAEELGLPVTMHIRDAFDDFFAIVEARPALQGIVHCFTGDAQIAERILEKTQLFVSFSGIVTFKNAPDIQEAAKIVPLERMLIETDSPFLAPVPHRGKSNEPSFVYHVARHIADLKNISFKEVSKVTSANAIKLLGLEE